MIDDTALQAAKENMAKRWPGTDAIYRDNLVKSIIKSYEDARRGTAMMPAPGSRDYQDMVVYAFRYCLGRQTYCTMTCAEYLIHHWKDFEYRVCAIIIKEIQEAIERNAAGAACDVKNWNLVLDYAKRNGDV